MGKENRNVVQKKKDNKLFYVIMTILFIVLDFIIVLNYSKLKLKYPDIPIMDRLMKLSEILGQKEAIKFTFNNELKEEFINTQKNLIIPYAILCMVLLSNILKPKSDFKGIEHGSASWATKESLKRFNKPDGSFVLGDGIYLDPKDKKNKNCNELLVGGSGAGKSFLKVKPDIMQMVGSYIVTDPKGELYRDTAKLLKKNGYKVKVLNILQPKYSDGYNPFKYINKDTIESDVLVLVNVFMKNTSDQKQPGGDKFWDDATKAIMTAIIFYLVLEDDEEKCFERVFELVRNVVVDEETGEIDSSKSELERIFLDIEKRDPYHPGLQAYQEFKLASGKTAKSILISVAVRLNLWINQDICTMTHEDELEIEKIGTEKTAIFLITPDTDDTFNVIATFFYTQVFKVLFYEADFHHNGKLPLMVSLELDEFANIGEIPNFDRIIATCRSRNVRVMPVLQSISQLEKLYKDSWETIMDNCYVINYIGSNSKKTHKYFSEKLGKTTVYIETRGESKSSKSASFSENGNYIARDLMTPSEISGMDDKNSLIFIPGMNPIFAEKFKTKNHPHIKDVGSSFPDGIPNNTNIIKEYSEKAEKKKEQFLERRRKKIKKKNDYNEMILKEEEDIEKEIEREFEEVFN